MTDREIEIEAALSDVWLALVGVDEEQLPLLTHVARAAYCLGVIDTHEESREEIEDLRKALDSGYRGAPFALPVGGGMLVAGAS